MISPIFTTIVISFLIIMIFMKITTNKFNTGDSEVLEKERRANSTRRKSLDELNYVIVPYDSLPFVIGTEDNSEDMDSDNAESSTKSDKSSNPDSVLANDENKILSLQDKKIVNFSNISNTDLKMEYGAANLPMLSEYDQNYSTLVKGLDSWGAHLIERNKIKDARKVLEFSVNAGSDIKSTYTMLASIYAENFEFDRIDDLYNKADQLNNSLMRRPIMRAMKEFSDVNNYISSKNDSSMS